MHNALLAKQVSVLVSFCSPSGIEPMIFEQCLKKKLPKWYRGASLINLCTMNLCNSLYLWCPQSRYQSNSGFMLLSKNLTKSVGSQSLPQSNWEAGKREFSKSEDERAAAPPLSRLFLWWNSFILIAPEAENRVTLKNCSWDHLEIQAHYTMTESINKRSENFVCSGRWLRPVLYVNVAPHVRNIEIILMSTTSSVVPFAMFSK